MVVQGCRQVGLYRFNLGDIIRRRGEVGLGVEAKSSVRVIRLTPDVASILDKYLKAKRLIIQKKSAILNLKSNK